MPQGTPISVDVQWIVVRLGATLSAEDIVMYTNISERKVKEHGKTWGISSNVNDMEKGGYSMKKLTRTTLERSAEKRSIFATRIGTYEPNQLVFVKESAVDCRTTYNGHGQYE